MSITSNVEWSKKGGGWFLSIKRYPIGPKQQRTQKKMNRQTGFTLVETFISITILSIAVIGTTGFRYFSALESRKAASQITAARIGLMLCESWRGLDGDETYDPVSHLGSDLQVSQGAGPAHPDDFALLGSYTVAFDDVIGVENYMTTLSWKDVQPGLRALNVVVAWASREQLAGAAQQIDGMSVDKSYELTVYTRTY
jgi:hypothetical protein